MKREILFRGKRKDNGKWIFGYLKIGSGGKTYISVCEKTKLGDNWLVFEVDPETVGEYTGLLDCKGQRIFEGDIVQFDYAGLVHKGKIVYQTNECEWDVLCPETMGYSSISSLLSLLISFEVIGNIHDQDF